MFCPAFPQRLVEIAAEKLLRESTSRDREQAPHGLDSLPETDLHPLLEAGFTAAGLGVCREWPYPAWPETPAAGPESAGPADGVPPRQSRRPPLPRDRQRCDLVLLPDAAAVLIDPIARRIASERAAAEVSGTLFAGLGPEVPVPGVEPEGAFWLELKATGQFCYTRGVPGPNRSYTAEMFAATADLPKLAADPHIRNAGLLIILFAADAETAEHDLGVVGRRCMERGTATSGPLRAGFPITDRIGNSRCEVALFVL
jgi:hypothetical protein